MMAAAVTGGAKTGSGEGVEVVEMAQAARDWGEAAAKVQEVVMMG